MIHRVPISSTARAHTGEVVAPVDSNFQLPTWEWIDQGRGDRVYATVAADLLDLWIGGYLAASRQSQLELRIEHAAGVRARLAADLVAEAEAGGETIDPTSRATLLGSSWDPPASLQWSHVTPLVLLDVFYVPFTPRPAPWSSVDGDVAAPSNLLWLRPSAETIYLRSLAAAGAVDLAERL